jgi:hypothetical protein
MFIEGYLRCPGSAESRILVVGPVVGPKLARERIRPPRTDQKEPLMAATQDVAPFSTDVSQFRSTGLPPGGGCLPITPGKAGPAQKGDKPMTITRTLTSGLLSAALTASALTAGATMSTAATIDDAAQVVTSRAAQFPDVGASNSEAARVRASIEYEQLLTLVTKRRPTLNPGEAHALTTKFLRCNPSEA